MRCKTILGYTLSVFSLLGRRDPVWQTVQTASIYKLDVYVKLAYTVGL
jgi:hypothetical protein